MAASKHGGYGVLDIFDMPVEKQILLVAYYRGDKKLDAVLVKEQNDKADRERRNNG